MSFITFTFFTKVEILTDTTFVSNTNYWECVTTITSNSIMNRFFLLHWFFSLKLFRFLFRFFLESNRLTNLFDYFRHHILYCLFNEFHALLFEMLLLLLPSFMTFFFSLPSFMTFLFFLFEIYHYWIPIWINCDHKCTLVIFT